MSHEELLTSVVGSHAHPAWFVSGIEEAERGRFGPADLAEMLDDAVDLAIHDQETAGIDVITDGEMRRAGFFTAACRSPSRMRVLRAMVSSATSTRVPSGMTTRVDSREDGASRRANAAEALIWERSR